MRIPRLSFDKGTIARSLFLSLGLVSSHARSTCQHPSGDLRHTIQISRHGVSVIAWLSRSHSWIVTITPTPYGSIRGLFRRPSVTRLAYTKAWHAGPIVVVSCDLAHPEVRS